MLSPATVFSIFLVETLLGIPTWFALYFSAKGNNKGRLALLYVIPIWWIISSLHFFVGFNHENKSWGTQSFKNLLVSCALVAIPYGLIFRYLVQSNIAGRYFGDHP